MFDSKWLKTAQKKVQPLRAMAGNNFMANMNNLENIKHSQPLLERESRKAEDYDKEYSEGIKFLKEFTRSSNFDNLRKAANKFFDALRCAKTKVEPYLYLAYIFYVFNQRKKAVEYLEIARSVDSTRPEIPKIQKIIYSNF